LKFTNDETTIAQLKDRIAKAIDYLESGPTRNLSQGIKRTVGGFGFCHQCFR